MRGVVRPLRLTLRAFGPYAEVATVDFDALRADGVFLIHGATGSGKTFLLDALSFALYGEVSGERTVASLRSDHADPAAEPSVALEFEVQDTCWLVERVPAHQRLGLRAGGPVDKPARAALSRRAGDNWETVATGATEVKRLVADLVGLTAHQFRQVIVLPQGHFTEVLQASSDTREDLLKTLFDSVLYESVALTLDHRARDAAARFDTTERDLAAVRRQAHDRWREVITAGTPLDPAAPDPDHDPVPDQAGLDELVDRLVDATIDAEADAQIAEAASLDAAGALAGLHDTADRCARRGALLAERARLALGEPTVAEQRRRLGRADSAELLRGVIDDVTGADAHAAVAVRDLQAAEATFAIALTVIPASVTHRSAAAGRKSAAADHRAGPGGNLTGQHRDLLAACRADLGVLAQVAIEQRELTTEAAAASAAAAQLEGDVAAARHRLADLDEREVTLRTRRHEVSDAAARLDGLEAQARAAADRAAAASRLEQATRHADDLRRRHLDADRSLQDTRAAVNDRRAAYLDGIAAVLAGHLVDTAPCLVCGATEHPDPAAPAADAVNAHDVARAEQQVDDAQRAERAADAARRRADEELRGLRDAAGAGADDPDAAIDAADAAIARVTDAAAAARGAEALDAEISRLLEERTVVQATLDTDVPAAAVARSRAEACQDQAAELARRLHAALGPDLDPIAVLGLVDLAVEALARLTQANDEHEQAVRALDAARQRLDALIAASVFPEVGAATDALLPAAERAVLVGAVEAHERDTIAVVAQLAVVELAQLPLDPPDLDAAESAVHATRAVARRANEVRARLVDAARAIGDLADRHRELDQRSRGQREQVEILTRVADQCMGRNVDRVSLQRWVLATYLEEICELATRRLLTMTSHRYSLRVHRRRAARGAKSGLDLRVFDAHTGEERAVQSLSGGETFQASLALALAVADSVQQHTGGVHLDTLFIDEGFGTLDPHALELALDELDQLRAGGRTVGVISHVAGLRERIRVGIEVTTTPCGSTLRVGEVTAA